MTIRFRFNTLRGAKAAAARLGEEIHRTRDAARDQAIAADARSSVRGAAWQQEKKQVGAFLRQLRKVIPGSGKKGIHGTP